MEKHNTRERLSRLLGVDLSLLCLERPFRNLPVKKKQLLHPWSGGNFK